MKTTKEQLSALKSFLSDGSWRKTKEIHTATGITGVMLRKIATETHCMVSNTQDGYKLLEHATLAEIDHSIADLYSRITKMSARARAIAAYRDQHFPGEQGELELCD